MQQGNSNILARGIKNLFLFSAGHTYSNLSRLFLRLFTGVMFLQLGIRQILHYDQLMQSLTAANYITHSSTAMAVLITVELLCAMFIITGLLTRLAVLPPLVIMFMAEHVAYATQNAATDLLFNFQTGYPVMFIGIFIYMLLAGPGKISLDYLIALRIIEDKQDSDELEKA